MFNLLNFLPRLQNGDPAIVRYWKKFAFFINRVVWIVYGFFVAIYPWGWLHLLLGMWLAIMLFWAKEFPKLLRYIFYIIFVLYLVSLPYFMLHYM